jgi:hypothetical protein
MDFAAKPGSIRLDSEKAIENREEIVNVAIDPEAERKLVRKVYLCFFFFSLFALENISRTDTSIAQIDLRLVPVYASVLILSRRVAVIELTPSSSWQAAVSPRLSR